MEDRLKIDIGRRLIQLRSRLGYKQQQMAVQLRMAPISLNRIERGKFFPSAITLNEIAVKFNVSLDWLFYGKGDMFMGKGEAEKKKSGDIFERDVEEMVYLMRHIPLVRYAMMDHFQRFKVDNRSLIDDELSKRKETPSPSK